MKKFNYAVFFFLLTFILVACSEESSSNNETVEADNSSDDKINIGSTVITSEHAFYVDIIDGMEIEAEKQGVDITISDPKSDAETQNKQISDFIQQDVDGLIVYGVDPSSSVPRVEEAIDQGIPVVTADMELKTDKINTYVGTNNKSAGEEAGKFAVDYIEENLNGEADVGIVVWESSVTQKDRAQGFIDEVEKVPGAEVVAQLPGNDQETSLESTQSLLQSHPDLDIIFTTNEGGALGAKNALEISGEEDVKIIGFDITEQLATAIEDGSILATIAQRPKLMGETTVESVVAAIEGEELDSNIPLSVELVTQDNVDEFK
ncbi:MAG TPA: substrate-binding domain-containing protein [Candidatus Avamphibacillus sp.]|nr:substrate-binding domain-containing protein [Candidatus Avamphibacillus sp.]